MTYQDMMDITGLSRGSVYAALQAVQKRGFFIRANLSRWIINSSKFELFIVQQMGESSNSEPSDPENGSNSELYESSNSEPFSIKEKERKERNTPPISPPPDDSIPFKPPPGQSKHPPQAAQRRVNAILAVCGLSADIPAHLAKAETAAMQLSAIPPEEITRRYAHTDTPNGSWYWYRDDWRGKQGQQPTPEQVIATIGLKRMTGQGDRRTGGASVNDLIDQAMQEMEDGDGIF